GLAQGAMTGLMAVYAIAASARGVGIGVIALILSAHSSGMFGFSPVWGVFLDRIGRRDGLLAGAALIAIGGLTIGLPHAALSALGLFLVGLGWSGTYLGGTTVISDITTPAERGTALGFTDLLSAEVVDVAPRRPEGGIEPEVAVRVGGGGVLQGAGGGSRDQ